MLQIEFVPAEVVSYIWNPLNVEVTGSFIFIYIVNLSLYGLTLQEDKI